jgi:hypothetical protein
MEKWSSGEVMTEKTRIANIIVPRFSLIERHVGR